LACNAATRAAVLGRAGLAALAEWCGAAQSCCAASLNELSLAAAIHSVAYE